MIKRTLFALLASAVTARRGRGDKSKYENDGTFSIGDDKYKRGTGGSRFPAPTRTVIGDQVFDLDAIDKGIRDPDDPMKAAELDLGADVGHFAFKIGAQDDWKAAEAGVDCPKSTTTEQAFFIPDDPREACIAFPNHPKVNTIEQTAPTKNDHAGFALTWEADRCPFGHDQTQKFSVTINFVCNKPAPALLSLPGLPAADAPTAEAEETREDHAISWGPAVIETFGKCETVATYQGPEGCPMGTVTPNAPASVLLYSDIGAHSMKSQDPLFYGCVGSIMTLALLATFYKLKQLKNKANNFITPQQLGAPLNA